MPTARVTIVLATYNRPTVLPYAIRSVLRQKYQNWRLLVIGDCCDARTAEAVNQFQDGRISYLNLPKRCGEQALPNSVGMAAAETEYIALLNQDDIWLHCHLERAIAKLDKGNDEWFIGRAAYVRKIIRNTDSSVQPVITEIHPEQRSLAEAFYASHNYLEPCSAWVLRRSLFDRVGPWIPGIRLYRTALNDWAMRAWRAGAKAHFSAAVSCIKIGLHHGAEGALYDVDATGYCEIEQRFATKWSRRALPMIESDLKLAAQLGWQPGNLASPAFPNRTKENALLARNLISPAMAEVFLATGWDAFDQYCALTGLERGFKMRRILSERTGEAIAEPPAFTELVQYAR